MPRALFACLLLAAGVSLGAQQPRADLILLNGRILTVDADDPGILPLQTGDDAQ